MPKLRAYASAAMKRGFGRLLPAYQQDAFIMNYHSSMVKVGTE